MKLIRDFYRLIGHKRKRQGFSENRRKRVKRRDGNRCRYCGNASSKWHLDHVIPISWGGHDYTSNLVLSCPSCNLKKGATVWTPRPLPLWRRIYSIFLLLWYNDFPSWKDFM